MPTFIASAVAWVSGIGSGLLAGTTLGAFMVMYAVETVGAAVLLGGLALSSAQANRAKRNAKDAYNAAQVDRMVNVVTTSAPRELVLGRVRKGGAVFFRGSAGTNKETFCMAITLAAHEIDAVEQIYFNDVAVTLDGSGYVTDAPYALGSTKTGTATANGSGIATLAHTPIAGSVSGVVITGTGESLESTAATIVSVVGTTVTTDPGANISYQYSDGAHNAKVWWALGTASQAADARLITLFPTLWTAAHQAKGVAYLVCEFTYSETAFPSGLPNVTALLRGAKVWDPRSSTTAWSDNPALLLRHVYQHPQFGKATVSAAEDLRIIAAANACDVTHGYVVDGVTTTQAIYKAGIVAQYGAPARSLFDDLSQAMGGMWAFAGGALYLKPGVYSAPVLTLADADLAVVQRVGASESQSPVTISTHRERAQKFNTVNVHIWDAAQDYKQVSLTPLTASALVTRDGAVLTQEVTFSGIGYAPQALHVAGVMMRDARDPLTVALPFKLRAYPIELFDTIALTLSRYGWSAKTFIVMGREWTAAGFVSLTLKETGAAIYTPDAAFLPQGYELNTQLPQPWNVPLVGPLTVTSGDADLLIQADGTIVNRMRVTWPALTDRAVTTAGQIEVQFRRADESGAWASAVVPGNETQVFLEGVLDRMHYIIRARARTSVAVGDWCEQVQHQVGVKTTGPANYDTFNITFSADGTRVVTFAYTTTPVPRDLAGARIKFMAGFGTPVWASMTLLDAGLFGGGFETIGGTPGDWTFGIVAVDTTGNESATPVYIQRTLPVLSGAAAATLLTLDVSGYFFIFADAAATTSASPTITFNAVLTNVTGTATFVATAYNAAGASLGTITLGGSGNSRTLSAAQFVTYAATDTVKVVATLGALSDTSTAYRANNGTDTILCGLSNEAHTIPTASDGSGGNFTGASGIVKVYQGTVDVTSSWSFTAAVSAVGGTFNGSALPVTTPFTGVASPAYVATSLSADTGVITITATRTGFPTQTRTFSLAKSKAGATGATGATGSTGATGGTGATGNTGNSAARAYATYTGNPTVSGAAVVKSGTALPATTDFSPTSLTSWTSTVQTPGTGNTMFQSDGIYNPVTNQTTWGTPYLSNFKVGSLSALSADLGTITAGTITGATIQTAASGARLVMDASSFKTYNSGGTQIISMLSSGFAAGIDVDTSSVGSTYGIRVINNGASGVAAVVGSWGTTGSGNGVHGTANAGNGVYGQSVGTGNGGLFQNSTNVVRCADLNYALNIVSGTFRYGSVTMSAFPGTLTSMLRGDGTWGNPTSINFGTGSGAKVSTNGGGNLAFGGSTAAVTVIVGDAIGIAPGATNSYSCGISGLSWSNVYTQNAVTVTSDVRLKKDIADEVYGLDFIRALRPITYRWKSESAAEPVRHGLLAQELGAVVTTMPVDFAGWSIGDGPGATQGIGYTELIAPLIKAMQELADEVDRLKAAQRLTP